MLKFQDITLTLNDGVIRFEGAGSLEIDTLRSLFGLSAKTHTYQSLRERLREHARNWGNADSRAIIIELLHSLKISATSYARKTPEERADLIAAVLCKDLHWEGLDTIMRATRASDLRGVFQYPLPEELVNNREETLARDREVSTLLYELSNKKSEVSELTRQLAELKAQQAKPVTKKRSSRRKGR